MCLFTAPRRILRVTCSPWAPTEMSTRWQLKVQWRSHSQLEANLLASSSINKAHHSLPIWRTKPSSVKLLQIWELKSPPSSRTSMETIWRVQTLWFSLRRTTHFSSLILDLSATPTSRTQPAASSLSISVSACSSPSSTANLPTHAAWLFHQMRMSFTLPRP